MENRNQKMYSFLDKLNGITSELEINPNSLVEIQEKNPNGTVFIDDKQINGEIFTTCIIDNKPRIFNFSCDCSIVPNMYISLKEKSNRLINEPMPLEVSANNFFSVETTYEESIEMHINKLYKDIDSKNNIKPKKEELDNFVEKYKKAKTNKEVFNIRRDVISYERAFEETKKAIKFYTEYKCEKKQGYQRF